MHKTEWLLKLQYKHLFNLPKNIVLLIQLKLKLDYIFVTLHTSTTNLLLSTKNIFFLIAYFWHILHIFTLENHFVCCSCLKFLVSTYNTCFSFSMCCTRYVIYFNAPKFEVSHVILGALFLVGIQTFFTVLLLMVEPNWKPAKNKMCRASFLMNRMSFLWSFKEIIEDIKEFCGKIQKH